jgi:hypothetical protein
MSAFLAALQRGLDSVDCAGGLEESEKMKFNFNLFASLQRRSK